MRGSLCEPCFKGLPVKGRGIGATGRRERREQSMDNIGLDTFKSQKHVQTREQHH